MSSTTAASPSFFTSTNPSANASSSQNSIHLFSLFIINKAGGLIYHYQPPAPAAGHPKLTANELLVLAGTFHGIHVISSKLHPLGLNASNGTGSAAQSSGSGSSSGSNHANTGIQQMLTDSFQLLCHQSATGTKFIITASTLTVNRPTLWVQFMDRLLSIYADWVMKNPFYQPEMPVRCILFDREIQSLFQQYQQQLQNLVDS